MAITRRQREVYDFISRFVAEHGYSPSFEEIGNGLDLNSLATVHKHITNLEKKGLLTRDYNRSRSIDLLEASLGRQQVDGAAAVVVAGEQSLFLEVGDVLVHRGQRVQVKPVADLFKRRRVAMLRHEAGDEVIHFALPACDRHAGIVGEYKANVK